MQYQFRCVLHCQANDGTCREALLDAAQFLEDELKAAGACYTIDIRCTGEDSAIFNAERDGAPDRKAAIMPLKQS
jgi:hypothetical protein